MGSNSLYALGLDFGTESVRALVVDLAGNEVGCGVAAYSAGQIIEKLPAGELLPPNFALQDPGDWLTSAFKAVSDVVGGSGVDSKSIVGVGVDFTSCTMLPTTLDGTPLCKIEAFQGEPHAWPKLWKHHGAQQQADRMTEIAAHREEAFLRRYGGVIGLEWFFPKMLEVIDKAPEVFHFADIWLEAGDWFVWQLVGGDAQSLPRSTCQAGYKAMWSAEDGYPSAEYLASVHPDLATAVETKMPGRLSSPGTKVGGLCERMARAMGLTPGTPISAAIIDAHAGVPGVGAASEGTMVMVVGTSSCHMLNSKENCFIPGVAGVVKDGILPGYYGYETGQAAVGDAFDWLRKCLGHVDHDELAREAMNLSASSDGVLAIDWMNGCRTPLMNGNLAGAFVGLRLHHRPAHLYRALLESSAFGLKWIIESLQQGGVPVRELVATGGLPHNNPGLMQIYADVLGRSVSIHPTTQGPATGAAVLGALAAGSDVTGFATSDEAIKAMAAPSPSGGPRISRIVEPNSANDLAYTEAYARYRELTTQLMNMENSDARSR